MRHRLQYKLFDGKKYKSRSPSTFIETMLHSKSTYFYRWESSRKNINLSKLTYVVPSVCGLALLVGGIIAINPSMDNTMSAYAESGIAPMSVDPDSEANISLIMGAASGEFNPADTTATTVTADQVTFRPYKFQVRYAQTSQYAVQLNSMNGYGNVLKGRDNPTAIINGVGNGEDGKGVFPANFGNNTWGFALARNSVNGNTTGNDEDNLTSADYTQYKYSTVPEYSAQTGQNTKIVDTPVNPDNNQTEAQTDDWTLAFAAKIGSDSPADHYISKVYLSVVRTPGRVYTVTYNANKPAGAASDTEVTGLPEAGKYLDNGASSIWPLSDAKLKLKKYTFLGWSTEKLAVFPKADKSTAKNAVQYQAGSNINLADFAVAQNDINLYAVWVEGGGVSGIDTMQEMNTTVCTDSEVGDTNRLRDTRDDNYYWVAKLKDNNCWMTQNLDYNIPTDLVLHAADTNISKDITLPGIVAINNDTPNGVAAWPMTEGSGKENSGSNVLVYYDPGKMLKTNPATTENCSGASYTKLNQQGCLDAGWKDVSIGYTPKATAPEGDTQSDTSAANSVINETDKTYDAHYLSGNYYSWALATANSAWSATIQSTQAPDSICPKGWKLPTSSKNISQYPTLSAGSLDSYNVSGSFAYLFRQYGLATTYDSGNVAANGYNVYDAPLYYLRSGHLSDTGSYGAQHGYINGAGNNGHYWSSVMYNGTHVYAFTFGADTNFNPSYEGSNRRNYGYTIRCVHDPAIAEVN